MFEYFVVLLFGLILGNFGTSIMFRIPRRIPIDSFSSDNSDGKPFCSVCHHTLRFHEYLPLIGWLYTRGKCRYCKAKISNIYFILESGSAVWSLLCHFRYGFDDVYFVTTLMGAILLTQSLMYFASGMIASGLNMALFITGILYSMIESDFMNTLFKMSIGLLGYVMTILTISKFNRELIGNFERKLKHIGVNTQTEALICLTSIILWLSNLDLFIIGLFTITIIFSALLKNPAIADHQSK